MSRSWSSYWLSCGNLYILQQPHGEPVLVIWNNGYEHKENYANKVLYLGITVVKTHTHTMNVEAAIPLYKTELYFLSF